ncbi:MAG TPA: UDP-N-acetylmuramoyl-L-alanine--D-glutamate ligase, partial [Pseudonocardiaceae bacterium]
MDLSGAAVLVAGARVTGRALLAALTPLGARTTVTDDSPSALQTYAQNGVAVIDSANAVATISDYDLVVTSPGFPPTAPVLAAAATAGVPIWGDIELAWRLDNSGRYGPPRRW